MQIQRWVLSMTLPLFLEGHRVPVLLCSPLVCPAYS